MTGRQETSSVRGLWLMAAAMIWLPGIDAFGKLLGEQGMSAGQLTLIRFGLQVCFLAPLLFWLRQWRPVPGTLGLQLARGVLMMLATFCFFNALRVMPMAEALAIFFVEPMVLTLLSALLLGETIHFRRIATIIIGFVGALIIIRPNFIAFGWPALWPLGTALGFAGYMILTRRLAGRVPAFQMQMNVGLAAIAAILLLMLVGGDMGGLFSLRQPVGIEWVWLLGLGLVATSGHLLLVAAARHAPASLLAPFQYIEIVSAALLGFLIFGDIPALATWAGMAIIIGAGLYLAHRERQLERDLRPAAARTG